MKYILFIALFAHFSFGCSTSKKNPDIIFETLEENPERLIEVISRASVAYKKIQIEKLKASIKLEQEQDLKTPQQPKLTEDRLLAGNPVAKITIVLYANYQCAECKTTYDSVFKFKQKYGDEVNIYYKHMTTIVHRRAYRAATYFEGIRMQDRDLAQKFSDILFKSQQEMNSDTFFQSTIESLGPGLNKKKLYKDFLSDTVRKTIEEDVAEFQSLGFKEPPSLVMNGVRMRGPQTLEELERVMNLILKK